MDSDDFRFWGTIAAFLATVFMVVVSVLVLWISYRHTENMARLGYEETTDPGTSDRPVWRKSVPSEPVRRTAP